MKKTILNLTAVLLFATAATAQTSNEGKINNSNFFVELGGIGGPYSFTFDKRLHANRIDGIGLRGGFSGLYNDEEKIFSVPMQVNWLMGKNKSFFEIGAGLTYFHYDGYTYNDGGNYICDSNGCRYAGGKEYAGHFVLPISRKNSFFGTFNFGYRRVPQGQGFTWKVALTPMFNENGFWPLFGGFAIGYKF